MNHCHSFFWENHMWLATCFAKTFVSQSSQSEKVCMYMLCEKTYNLHGDAIWTGRLRPLSPSDWRKKHPKVAESEMFTSSKKCMTKNHATLVPSNTTFINNRNNKHIRMRLFFSVGVSSPKIRVFFFAFLALRSQIHLAAKMATFGGLEGWVPPPWFHGILDRNFPMERQVQCMWNVFPNWAFKLGECLPSSTLQPLELADPNKLGKNPAEFRPCMVCCAKKNTLRHNFTALEEKMTSSNK